MSSSTTIKPNPFQRANPFQAPSPYQPQLTPSYLSHQAKPSYLKTFEPQIESYTQKENSFLRKQEPEVWKFREDNCGKQKVFGQQNHQNGMVLLGEKNSFQKQLVMSSVGRRNNTNSGQESLPTDRPLIAGNPFARKYLMTSNILIESQVHPGFPNPSSTHQPSPYQRFKTDYDTPPSPYTPISSSPTYNNYIPYSTIPPVQQVDTYINNLNSAVGSVNNLETSLHYKQNDYKQQYGSRKSIERDDSYHVSNNRLGSYHNVENPVESRYSLERQREKEREIDAMRYNNNIGSNKDIYPPPSYPSMRDSYAKATQKQGTARRFSRVSERNERVNFEQSDDEESRHQSREKHRQPTFGSRNNLPEPKGPQSIMVNGCKFYRQRVECY